MENYRILRLMYVGRIVELIIIHLHVLFTVFSSEWQLFSAAENILIVSMAIHDLLVAIFSPPKWRQRTAA